MAKTKKPTPQSSSAKKQTGSDFIRLSPPTMTAAEIVTAGEAAGLKISTGLVYMVRSRMAKTGGAAAKKRGRPRKDPTQLPVSKTVGTTALATKSSDELELAKLILNLGFAKARAVFTKLEAALA